MFIGYRPAGKNTSRPTAIQTLLPSSSRKENTLFVMHGLLSQSGSISLCSLNTVFPSLTFLCTDENVQVHVQWEKKKICIPLYVLHTTLWYLVESGLTSLPLCLFTTPFSTDFPGFFFNQIWTFFLGQCWSCHWVCSPKLQASPVISVDFLFLLSMQNNAILNCS